VDIINTGKIHKEKEEGYKDQGTTMTRGTDKEEN